MIHPSKGEISARLADEMKDVPRSDTPILYLCRNFSIAMDRHAQRIEIFNDTLAILKRGWYISKSGARVDLPHVNQVIQDAQMGE